MRSINQRALLPVTALCISLLAGCGGGSDTTAPAPAPGPTTAPPSGPTATVTGTVFAANVTGSTVQIFAADAQGRATGSALATATTDANGAYTLSLSQAVSGPVVIVATGGSYTSEADKTTQTLGTFSTLLTTLASGANTAQVNPITTSVAAATSYLLAQANPPTLSTALAQATTSVNKLYFGATSLQSDASAVAPSASATQGDAWLLAALAGTLEQLRVNSGVKAADLYKALQDDISDGKLDGLKNGQSIALGSGTLQASLFTTEWSGAANTYGSVNPTYTAATQTISGALQSSAQANGIAVGSSGSVAPLVTTTNGTQMFFAARADGLVQLNMKDPANPTASKVTAINQLVMQSSDGKTGYFTSLDGIVINPTPINNKVYAIAYSYGSATVVALNLTDSTVAGTLPLNLKTQGNFSGANAYVAGGIAQGLTSTIWLATQDGMVGVNPANLSATSKLISMPSGFSINENLGGDPALGLIYSPDYNNNGLVAFNLNDQKAYTFSGSAYTTLVSGWSAGELDGAALDPLYKVAVVNPEGSTAIGLFTYDLPSGATGASGTFSKTPSFMNYHFNGSGSFAGSAIDPISHTVLMVGEGSSVGVGVLDNPANGASWKGFSKFVSAGYGSAYSFEPHDPHTLGAFNILGKPYGFLLNNSAAASSNYEVVVLDLNAFLAAKTDSNGNLTADFLADTTIAKRLKY